MTNLISKLNFYKLIPISTVPSVGLPSALASRCISQDTLREWERLAREQTGCVINAMVAQLKTLHSDKGKGKASGKLQHAVDELDNL